LAARAVARAATARRTLVAFERPAHPYRRPLRRDRDFQRM